MLILAAIAGVLGCGEKVPQVASEDSSNWGKNDPPVPPKPTLPELRKKAEAGDVLAMVELGKAYDLGRNWGKSIQFNYIEVRDDAVPLLDREKAAEWYEKAAKHGNVEALGRLGRLFYMGSGVPKDLVKALERFQSAALQGDAIAQYGLGGMYLAGDGIPKDDIKGRDWIEKSAAQTLPDAQNLLGVWYEAGYVGFPKDAVKAVEWWQKAAAQGYAFAQLSLGQAYRDGSGVPIDTVKAVEWFEKSAAQGFSVSQMILGEVYADGKGVLVDSVLAYAWLNLASGKGIDVAGDSRDRVARRMTPFELAEAQRLSSKWKTGQILVREGASGNAAPSGGTLSKRNTGTAFVVSKTGHAITNQHVTTGCTELRIQGHEGLAKLITEDVVNDLALIRIPAPVTDAAAIASDPGSLRQGEDVVVFGFPLNSVLSSGGNLTPGVVSALTGLGNNTNQIQITAPIQPGSSGSPVLNKKGAVIGVVSMKLSDSKMVTTTGSVGQNVSFAVNGQTLKAFLDMHKVTYNTGRLFSWEKTTADLADEARKWTMVIECWR
jgi:TPR repeat protein